MIFVVIPVFNRIDHTQKCIESIVAQGLGPDQVTIVVVDDGSTDGTKAVLAANYPEVEVIDGTGELYWTGSVARGISYVLPRTSSKDYILLLNNDVILASKAIEKLIDYSESVDRKALVNAVSVDVYDKETIIKSGTVVVSWFFNRTRHVYQGQSYHEIDLNMPVKVDLLTGRCLLHPVEIFNDIGNYDSVEFPHYGGDDEYSCRAKSNGYELIILPSALTYLDPGTTGDTSSLKADGTSSIYKRLFGIKSNINILTKWKIAKRCVPTYAFVSYYIIGVAKSIYILVFGS